MPGLAGASQAGPQFGRNGPLTSLPGSEFNQAQWHDGQVREAVLSLCLVLAASIRVSCIILI